jgi:hypothetical protein
LEVRLLPERLIRFVDRLLPRQPEVIEKVQILGKVAERRAADRVHSSAIMHAAAQTIRAMNWIEAGEPAARGAAWAANSFR